MSGAKLAFISQCRKKISMLLGGPFHSGAPRLCLPCLPSRDAAVSKCPHTSTRCSSEQRPSTGVRMHPINTNLHAASCQRDNASRHPQKQQCLVLSRRAEADDQHALHINLACDLIITCGLFADDTYIYNLF